VDVLQRIKRLVLTGHYRFTIKALDEMAVDVLTPNDVVESIGNARRIEKTLRSRPTLPGHERERLYVIQSYDNDGTLIYTKGKIFREPQGEVFYILVSAKISTSRG